MRVRVSPIIHARTKDIDFRSQLLVVPEDFRMEEIQWAKKYIIDSTQYFELAGEEGRRVVFCNDHYIIHGISIRIGDLYRKCGKEPKYNYVDGNRTNYAFIGLVMLKKDLNSAIDIPYSTFLEEYEKYMEIRWNDLPNSPQSLEHQKVSYQEIEVQKAERIYPGSIPEGKNKVILPENPVELEEIVARVMKIMLKRNVAFCSNMPNRASIMKSHFDIVTSLRADSILASMQKNDEKKENFVQKSDEKREKFVQKSDKKREKFAQKSDEEKESKDSIWNNKYMDDKGFGGLQLGIFLAAGAVLGAALVLGIILIK